jgi:hypothetical protein
MTENAPCPPATARRAPFGALVLAGCVAVAASGAGPWQRQALAADMAPPAEGQGTATPDAAADAVQSLLSKLQTLEQRLGQSEQREQAISAGAARVAQLQAASAALEAGKPLGAIAGAPPALARFATVAPPTEASLRLSFPAASRAAAQASAPSTEGLSLTDRMLQQVQALVTIREGDKVLIGAPAAHVLAQAQARLDAGDLAGAVATLDELDPGAARAIAGWRDQAQALLDARAALAGLVHS